MHMCLEGFIGLVDCTQENPQSGLFINSLPGFSTARISSVSGSEDVGARQVWETIEARAIRNFKSDVLKWMPETMKLNRIIHDLELGTSENTSMQEDASAEYKGYYIKIYGSRHMTAHVERVQFYAAAAATVTFKVFDALDGRELYTADQTVIAGWNFVNLTFKAPARGDRIELFVCYDADGINSMQTQSWTDWDDYAICDHCDDKQGYVILRNAKVAIGTPPIERNLSRDSQGYGMLVRLTARCGTDGFICENRTMLANAFLHKCGIEFLMESLMNPLPFNVWNAINREEKEAAINVLETIYSQEMESALTAIKPVTDNVCFVCNSPIQYHNKTPG